MAEGQPSFCNTCGKQLSSVDRFCPQCGKAIAWEQSPPPQSFEPQPMAPPLPPPPVKKKSVIVPLLAVIVVVIIVAASFTYFMGDEFGLTTSTYSVGEGNQIYVWDYGTTECWLYTNLTFTDFSEYQSSSIDRRLTSAYDYSLCTSYVTSDDPIIEDIAAKLLKVADHLDLDDVGTVNLALAFSQAITYRYDNETSGSEDYWKFPVETLYLRCGDCEDKSFLFASLVEEMGYDAICLVFDDHLAVGVACPGAYGTYYEKWGSQYYYCETTAIGWKLGDIPDDYGAANLVQVE